MYTIGLHLYVIFRTFIILKMCYLEYFMMWLVDPVKYVYLLYELMLILKYLQSWYCANEDINTGYFLCYWLMTYK